MTNFKYVGKKTHIWAKERYARGRHEVTPSLDCRLEKASLKWKTKTMRV